MAKEWSVNKEHDGYANCYELECAGLTLLEFLRCEKEGRIKGGIYHKVQVDLTYNSNHSEGSKLTHEQTRYIFETNTIDADDTDTKENGGAESSHVLNVDDIVEKFKASLDYFRILYKLRNPKN